MQVAFDTLKQLFSTQPILVHFDPDKPSVVEVDASDVIVTGILSQYDSEDVPPSCRLLFKEDVSSRMQLRDLRQGAARHHQSL